MIKAYSQRMTPPFSGQVQITESERARAISMDGKSWEFYFIYIVPADGNSPERRHQRRYSPVAMINSHEFSKITAQETEQSRNLDDSILELVTYLSSASLPFAPIDHLEYWLLDPADDSPLALVFSCANSDQMKAFPSRVEWTALPAAVMKVERSAAELENGDPPVNYQVERMVAERAGYNAKGKWFDRCSSQTDDFPPLLIREDWPEQAQSDLCQRYLQRQSSRLLMLHGLAQFDRERLESSARINVFETERFYSCYPEIIDQKLMNTILVEARLRQDSSDESHVAHRRDGVHYL